MPHGSPSALRASVVNFQHCHECFLWKLDTADGLHALFAFLLFFKEFALARDVAAVAFREDILAAGAHVLARDDFAPDGRLAGG